MPVAAWLRSQCRPSNFRISTSAIVPSSTQYSVTPTPSGLLRGW